MLEQVTNNSIVLFLVLNMNTCDSIYWNIATFLVPFILFVGSEIVGNMKNPPFDAKSVLGILLGAWQKYVKSRQDSNSLT